MIQENKAVFLDRDGVINKEKGYITDFKQLEIFPYAKKAIQIIKKLGFLTIVVTNQSAVARGLVTEAHLKKMNDYLQENLSLDAVYYCPHLPPGNSIEDKSYIQNCNCRKPSVGMVRTAVDELAINLEKSYMVGDRASDIIMGQTIGLKTVLLNSGYGLKNLEQAVYPDYIFETLFEFTEFLRRDRA